MVLGEIKGAVLPILLHHPKYIQRTTEKTIIVLMVPDFAGKFYFLSTKEVRDSHRE